MNILVPQWLISRWIRRSFQLTTIICTLSFLFTNTIADNFRLDSMTDSELMTLKKQLQKQSDDLRKQIESGFVQMNNYSRVNHSENADHQPLCMIIREKSNNTSLVLSAVESGLSLASSVFTSAGPVGELFHNYRTYYRQSTDIPIYAYGQPSLDFISNGCYIIHLGLDWSNGGDPMTFYRNAFPSLVVMAIETGIVLSLVFYKYRRVRQAVSEETLL